MHVDRRRFLQFLYRLGGDLGLDVSVIGGMRSALAAGNGLPTVVWLAGRTAPGVPCLWQTWLKPLLPWTWRISCSTSSASRTTLT